MNNTISPAASVTSDTRLPDQNGVVLGPAGQHLHGAADFLVPANDRVNLARLGAGRQVQRVFLQRVILVFGAGTVGGQNLGRRVVQINLCGIARDAGHLAQGKLQRLDHAFRVAASGGDQVACQPLIVVHQCLEKVFGGQPLVTVAGGNGLRGLNEPARSFRELTKVHGYSPFDKRPFDMLRPRGGTTAGKGLDPKVGKAAHIFKTTQEGGNWSRDSHQIFTEN